MGADGGGRDADRGTAAVIMVSGPGSTIRLFSPL